MKERAFLTEAQAKAVAALKGRVKRDDVAQRYGVSPGVIARIWRGETAGRARRVTDADREAIIQAWGNGADLRGCIEATGWSENTVRIVLDQARAEGDLRAHHDRAIRALAVQRRAAAGAAHREGGDFPRIAPPALPPNSLALSLTQLGMRPEVAVIVARQWEERRHAQQHGARQR